MEEGVKNNKDLFSLISGSDFVTSASCVPDA